MTDRRQSLIATLRAKAADISGYAPDDLSTARSFMELGFDSLALTQVATAFSRAFGVEITFRSLIEEHDTLAAVAEHLLRVLPDAVPEREPEPEPAPEVVHEAQPERPAAPGPNEAAFAPQADGQPLSVLSAGLTSGDDMAGLFAKQLDLMARQIDLLRGARGEGQRALTPSPAPSEAVAATWAASPPQAMALQDTEGDQDRPHGLRDDKGTKPATFGPARARALGDLTESQRAHIDALVDRLSRRTGGSKAHTQAARAAHADPRTAAGFNPLWKECLYPLVVARSEGAYLWDIDDNQY
ncbi:MAG: phosphopantetheine-binding protein, partial [Pseudomonadota bacterium]